jgi:hypothetical protein
MGDVTVSIELDASPAEVWAVVEPVERHVDWMADAIAIRFETDQTRGIGTMFLCDTKFGPIRLTDRMEITEWIPAVDPSADNPGADGVMGVRHTGLVSGTGVFTIRPLSGGTRSLFTWAEDLTFPWFFGGPLGEVVAGRLLLGPVWRRNLRALKRLVKETASETAAAS